MSNVPSIKRVWNERASCFYVNLNTPRDFFTDESSILHVRPGSPEPHPSLARLRRASPARGAHMQSRHLSHRARKQTRVCGASRLRHLTNQICWSGAGWA